MKTRFVYTGIRVKDLDKSVEFYTTVLGMKVEGRSRIDAAKGDVVGLIGEEGGHSLELNHYDDGSEFATDYSPGEGLDHLAFQVEDLDQAVSEATKAGYPPVLEIKTERSRWVYIVDPNGIYIELVS